MTEQLPSDVTDAIIYATTRSWLLLLWKSMRIDFSNILIAIFFKRNESSTKYISYKPEHVICKFIRRKENNRRRWIGK